MFTKGKFSRSTGILKNKNLNKTISFKAKDFLYINYIHLVSYIFIYTFALDIVQPYNPGLVLS